MVEAMDGQPGEERHPEKPLRWRDYMTMFVVPALPVWIWVLSELRTLAGVILSRWPLFTIA